MGLLCNNSHSIEPNAHVVTTLCTLILPHLGLFRDLLAM
jgi:hypothetical protein